MEEEQLYVFDFTVGQRGDVSADSGKSAGTWSPCGTTWAIPAKTVVAILFIMSAWSVGIMIDRALMYSAARKQSRVFVQQVAGALKDNKLDEAISIAERNKKSHIAKVVATGLVRVPGSLGAGER